MSIDAFELEIIEPTRAKKVSVFWIEVESSTGNFTVGPNHFPLISILKERGKLKYKEYSGTESSLDIYGGIFKVADNKAIVLLNE